MTDRVTSPDEVYHPESYYVLDFAAGEIVLNTDNLDIARREADTNDDYFVTQKVSKRYDGSDTEQEDSP